MPNDNCVIGEDEIVNEAPRGLSSRVPRAINSNILQLLIGRQRGRRLACLLIIASRHLTKQRKEGRCSAHGKKAATKHGE